jgi:hypothetical protein
MDVITEFLNRVAYKFPKGYPDLNDPADRDLLESLMALNEEEEKEEKKIDHKQRLIGLIQDSEMSNEVAQQIEKLLLSSTFKPSIIQYMADKGFTPEKYQNGQDTVDMIFNKLANSEIDDFIEYSKNPKKFSSIPKVGNFNSELGVPNKLISDLINIIPGVDSGGNKIGKAETFLGLMFSDINNRAGGGDLNWNGKNFEIKGWDGRFGQQAGRGAMADPLESIATSVIPEDELDEFLEEPINKYMTYGLYNLYNESKKHNTEKKAIQRIQKVIDQIYYSKGFAKKYFSKPEDLSSPEVIKNRLLKTMSHGYAGKTGVDYFLFFDNDSNYRVIDVNKIDDAIDNGDLNTKTEDAKKGFFFYDTYPNLRFKRE